MDASSTPITSADAARSTRFTRAVGCSAPLQLAGMSGGVIGVELAGAVGDAGGLPMIGAAGVDVGSVIDEWVAAGIGTLGATFLMPFVDLAQVEVAAARTRLVEMFWASPDPALVARVHACGALAGWQIGSVDDARAAADAGCDVIVVQGVEAGGHVIGTTPLMPLLTDVIHALRDRAEQDPGDREVIIVATGGIGTAAQVDACLGVGADAVRVGTRFVAARESRAHPAYRAALVSASGSETTLTTVFGSDTGWPDAPHRVLRASEQAGAHARSGEARLVVAPGDERPLPARHVMAPTVDCVGDVSAMAMYAGLSVDHIAGEQSARDICDELLAGWRSGRGL